jgi:hypothetical protein
MSYQCVFCRYEANSDPIKMDWYDVTCKRCGKYTINGTAEAIFQANPLQNSAAVSGWIRRQNTMGVTPPIIDDAVHLRALMKPPFQERVEQYLLALANKTSKLDQAIPAITPELIGTSYSDDPPELLIIVRHLQEQGLLTERIREGGETRRLTPKGYITAEELRSKRAAHTQAFVAMWFSDEMLSAYDQGFAPGIRKAGFEPMVISNKEHAGKIDDAIIAEIRRSAFLVADFTGQRQNVYFETGFAHGLGLQIIWTCRKEQIGQLHFDIRQYNVIDWEDEENLAQRLQRRIEAMFGRGSLATPWREDR